MCQRNCSFFVFLPCRANREECLPRRASCATLIIPIKADSRNSILGHQLRRRITPKGGGEGPGRGQEKNLLPDYGFKTRKDVMKVAEPQGFQVWEKISFFKISVFCIIPGGFFPKLGPDAMVQYLKDLLLEQRKRNKAHGRKKGTLVSRDTVLYRNNSQFVHPLSLCAGCHFQVTLQAKLIRGRCGVAPRCRRFRRMEKNIPVVTPTTDFPHV